MIRTVIFGALYADPPSLLAGNYQVAKTSDAVGRL